jgi:hypothetical protein
VVSVAEGDDPAFLEQVERRTIARVNLARRGTDHGAVCVLDPRGLVPPPPRRNRELVGALTWRWHGGRPAVLPRVLEVGPLERARDTELAEELARPGGLSRWLSRELAGTPFSVGDALEHVDPERDLERVAVLHRGEDAGLWAKSGRLSSHEGDGSLRARFSFGEEGADDDSDDEARHALTAALGRAALGELERIAEAPLLARALAKFTGGPPLLTQPIAYWNAPGGGARFHHDAFREEAGGQLGVLYVQVTGHTLWLALSLGDLAVRTAELAEHLAEAGDDELARLLADLGAGGPEELVHDPRGGEGLRRELAGPGCGDLGRWVDSPAMTALLADAGHAVALSSGDAIAMPNHGLGGLVGRTVMHSVFCGGSRTAWGLSSAIRARAGGGPA